MKIAKVLLGSVVIIAIYLLAIYSIFTFEVTDPQIYLISQPTTITPEPTTTLIAVGDIMLGRTVEQKMVNHQDWAYPFRETYHITNEGDIVFGNLEAPLIDGPMVKASSLVFRADPQTIEGLQFGGFNVLALANNHMKNYGPDGIKNTINLLDQANIYHFGAGLNDKEAREPAIIQVNDSTFGFLAYTDQTFTPASYEATATRAGSPFLRPDKLIADIESLKSQVDFIIVSLHAGTEYSHQPNNKQIEFAQLAIDSGANLVIGHHPHVIQPLEQYKDGYILYSLGNFIFDQMWSEPTRQSVIAKIIFNQDGIELIEFIPAKIYEYCQPRVLPTTEEPTIQTILNHLYEF